MNDKISVIVVDDDNDSLEVMSEYLSLKDVNVLAKASNGYEAFELYLKFHPGIILLDVIMPNYDGFYALEKIKEFDPNAKIIFVTAATAETTQKRIMNSDVSAILFKPFEMDNLVQTIEIVRNGGKQLPSSVRSNLIK